MKKILTVLAIALFLATSGHALDWHDGGKINIEWDAVPKIKDTDTISYVVYVKNVESNSEKIYAETATQEMIVDLNDEGQFYLGVSTKRVTESNITLESDINWSNENGEYTPSPFGVRFYVKPGIPKGLNIK